MLVLSLQFLLCFQSCTTTPSPLPAHRSVYCGETPAQSMNANGNHADSRSPEQGVADARAFLKPVVATANAKKQTGLVDDLTFMRRIFLDLTGKMPTPAQVDAFLNNADPKKRSALIELLFQSDAFLDRWSVFYEDMFRNRMIFENPLHRNAFRKQIRDMLGSNTPLDAMARAILTDSGDNNESSSMFFWTHIPVDTDFRLDQLDDQMGYVTETMLGVRTTCISCHDGAYHLEQVNVGLASRQRSDFWAMSAFLSKSFIQVPEEDDYDKESEFFRALRYVDTDEPGYRVEGYYLWAEYEYWNGEYNAVSQAGQGMRPPRSGAKIQPAYLFGGGTPEPGENRRQALARLITADRQFARNQVNRIWAHLFGEGFVMPLAGWDTARVNVETAAANQTTVQPRTPYLMEFMTGYLIGTGYDLKTFLRLIVNSQGYQSDFANTAYRPSYLPSYWTSSERVRRLDAESIIDGMFDILGVPRQYVVAGYPYEVVHSTWKLPGTDSPAIDALLEYDPQTGEYGFTVPLQQLGYENEDEYFFYQYSTMDMLLKLGRGDWLNGVARNSKSAPDRALLLMNDWGLNYYLDYAEYLPLVRETAERLERSASEREAVINDLFRRILYRTPNAVELSRFEQHLAQNEPVAGIRDLIWVLFQHPDFLYHR